MTELELAWAAGLFEGEGCVRINKPTMRNWGSLCATVTNTDSDIVEWFQVRWPGYMKPYQPAENRKQAWMWVIAARQAAGFLRAIRPYVVRRALLVKIDHGLAFQDGKRSDTRSMTDAQRYTYAEEQWNAYWWMCHLNRRGRAA